MTTRCGQLVEDEINDSAQKAYLLASAMDVTNWGKQSYLKDGLAPCFFVGTPSFQI